MTEQRIRLLKEHVINQIAAGEVIENPSSVIKELVENAIDAHSSELVIETKAAGRKLIKVSDNGWGMDPDNLLLSIERHATSKLQDLEEFDKLDTLGFRGEALPSIASVSKMSLHSATEQTSGALIAVDGGKIGKLVSLPRRRGTTIEVHSLFFNVPVRKKFQKSLSWDIGEIHRVISKFALCHPEIAISWINDGKTLISFPAQDSLQRRIKVLLGEDFTTHMVPMDQSCGQLRLLGAISLPALSRPNRTGQYLFVNKRSVVSQLIAKTVLESYGTRLGSHRYPLFILSLHLPPSWIDVNVHPQKKEIRISEELSCCKFILSSVEKTLETSLRPQSSPKVSLALPEGRAQPLYQPTLCFRSKEDDPQTLLPMAVKPHIMATCGPYALVERGGEMLAIDCSRAIERILYEETKEKKQPPDQQTLLSPLHLTLTGKEKALLQEQQGLLNEWGVSIRPFGQDSFIIDAIPALLEADEIKEALISFLAGGPFYLNVAKSVKMRRNFAQTAAAIVEKLFRCKNSERTPAGKTIATPLDKTTLERLFDAQDKKSASAPSETPT